MPLIAATLCAAFCVFELVIMYVLVKYLPEHRVTQTLLRLTRRADKTTYVGGSVLPFMNESDSEQPEDSSSMYESERETDKESVQSEIISPTTKI